MPLTLKIVSEHSDLVGDDAEREFREQGGTIGRALENDWILPDPDRYISGRHATIDYKGGIYYLLDTSSNGVYMNDEMEPIGNGNPRRLFNGDRMRMGDFEFTVEVDSGESLAMPLDDEPPSVAPDNIEQFVDEDVLRTGMQLLDEEELTGDDEFQSVMFGDEPPQSEADSSQDESQDQLQVAANDDAPAARKKKKTVDVSAEDLFDSFLDGVGISRAEFHATVNRPEMMLMAGTILREFVEGVTALLSSRANLKNTFRLDQTTVLPRHNNPLKFSENSTDLVKQLLIGGEGEYLGARDAVREVCRDLLNHQNAFLDAMNSAFIEFADRFEPDELQDGFNRTMSGSKLLSFMNKSKYWDLYRDLYPIITEKGGGRFPQMFAEEFVRAYERQVADYQRHDRESTPGAATAPAADDPAFMETQKLDNPAALAQSAPEESAFETDDIIDNLPGDDDGVDQSFIDELDNSMSEAIRKDQLKA